MRFTCSRLLFWGMGFKQFDKIDMIPNRAIRYFMGVHRFTPIVAITGDMGWVTSTHRRWVNLSLLWNRLVCVDKTRLTKNVSEYDYNRTGKTWCSDIKTIFGQVGLLSSFQNKLSVNLKVVRERLLNLHKLNWLNKIKSVSKLRTYKQFKSDFDTENYLSSFLKIKNHI